MKIKNWLTLHRDWIHLLAILLALLVAVIVGVSLMGCGGTGKLVKQTELQTQAVVAEARSLHQTATKHRVACEVRQEEQGAAEAKEIETLAETHVATSEMLGTKVSETIAAKDAEIADLKKQAGPTAKWKLIVTIALPLLGLAAAVYLQFGLKNRWLAGIVLGLGVIMGAGCAWAFYKSLIISGAVVVLVIGLAFVVVGILTKQEWLLKHIVGAVEEGRRILGSNGKENWDMEVSKRMDAEAKAEVRKIKDS